MEKKNQFFIVNFYLIFLESLQIKIVINASPLTLEKLKQQPKPQIGQIKMFMEMMMVEDGIKPPSS